ncbi:MAG: hypothetical protein JRH11_26515 [Deltaproteobacteria bacterium]|nr:hypothetical protein [Deltaproteobacteria bacterium]
MAERRLSTPIILTLASAMVSIGVVAVIASRFGGPADTGAPPSPHEIPIDTRTPEAAAETFLDAWRKRDHAICRDLAVEGALEAVLTRQEDDQALTADEREVKSRVWDAMATGRLLLELSESNEVSETTVGLLGVAKGEFLGRPYEREVEFMMVRVGDDWKVARMGLGDILTDMPAFLADPGETYDPSEFEMRGEEVP